jgi:hypothetical protein
MKKLLFLLIVTIGSTAVSAQQVKTELYDLIKKLLYDSTGYSNVGDWAIGNPKKFPVKWKDDRIEMSDDTSINLFRLGSAEITVNGKTFTQGAQAVKWNIMLKGPRMGYTNFSIISAPSSSMQPKYTIDSLFGKKNFKARLLKSCDAKSLTGFYYYELKLPKKDPAYFKISWINVNGNTAIRIDCYDEGSRYAAKLECPR